MKNNDCFTNFDTIWLIIGQHYNFSITIMNHLCFIVDNSLTMDQCPNNGITLLDSVKSSIENTLRNLSRLGFPNNHEHIHLFCTSNPKFYLSSFEHDESHLYCQVISILNPVKIDEILVGNGPKPYHPNSH